MEEDYDVKSDLTGDYDRRYIEALGLKYVELVASTNDQPRLEQMLTQKLGSYIRVQCFTVGDPGVFQLTICKYPSAEVWSPSEIPFQTFISIDTWAIRRLTYSFVKPCGFEGDNVRDECRSIVEEWLNTNPVTRQIERTRVFKEELMMNRWHPDRVFKLLELGYDEEDM